MADLVVRKMLEAFEEHRERPGFLMSFFNFDGRLTNAQKFEVEIRREDREVAVPVPSVAAGSRRNQLNAFTNKDFSAPIYMEELSATADEAAKRQLGQNPYDETDMIVANGMKTLRSGVNLVTSKIVRSMELQASQIFTGGAISLLDANGSVAFALDYGMRAAHKITGGAWSGAGNPITDLTNGCRLVKQNCGKRVKRAIIGSTAFANFEFNSNVQTYINSQLWNKFRPATPGSDYLLELGNYHGTLSLDGTDVELWTYDAEYKHPNTGAATRYVGANDIFLIAEGRREIQVGTIPRFGRMEPPFSGMLPDQFTKAGPGGYGLSVYAYMEKDKSAATIQVGGRPLVIPTELDSFARITVT